MFSFPNKGFTLIQLLISMSILLVLAAAVFLWIDPLARIGQAKNTTRSKDVGIIASALNTYAKEHDGLMPILGTITTSKRVICSAGGSSDLSCNGDSELCLAIDDTDFYKYLPQLPYDPDKSSGADSGYYLSKDNNNNLIVGACDTYNSEIITKNVGFKNTCIGGAYGGGHCWYVATTPNTNCNNACAALNLTCAKNANYGPDADNSHNPLCQLNKDLGYSCSISCTLSATGTPPKVGNACTIQNGSVICSQLPESGYYGICPCQ